jgi:hypothetical protein
VWAHWPVPLPIWLVLIFPSRPRSSYISSDFWFIVIHL